MLPLLLALTAILGASFWFFYLRDTKSIDDEYYKAKPNEGEVEDTGRDIIAALDRSGKKIAILYGSQTGTAEDYGTRFAKEIKSRSGLSSLVLDPEDLDFENLDTFPETSLLVFFVATYGEGEPTDNAISLFEFLKNEDVEFSQGNRLENLHYVIFGLGSSSYDQFCQAGKDLDARLTALGAKRVGNLGIGDDDKNLEEDYLSWKDETWAAIQSTMNWSEDAAGDVSDFKVQVLEPQDTDDDKVYKGELSARALSGARGVFDAKNPLPARLIASRELFTDSERNCVHAEFDISDSGIRYQTGDHIAVWPMNADAQVEECLKVLGFSDARDTVINVTSLDPALAKVPFPVPTTYDAVFRYYLGISTVASRQAVGLLAKYAPTDAAKETLTRLGSDKTLFNETVASKCLTTHQVLRLAADQTWAIPLDKVISCLPRLTPRFYSISSSPKLYPNSIHVTCVVLKYKPAGRAASTSTSGFASTIGPDSYVYGVGSNYIYDLMIEQNKLKSETAQSYHLQGPRDKYMVDSVLHAPVYVRKSNFRLPTSTKLPVVMVGPGTGVAPFRAFVQERVALARKAKARDGPDALASWGYMDLYYGCRRANEDFLYKDEWDEYAKELDGKLRLHVALSREPGQPKTYVQNLIKQDAAALAEAIVTKRGLVYICGDARNMARDVEHELAVIIGEASGGNAETGAKELKNMKDRNRFLLDVWS